MSLVIKKINFNHSFIFFIFCNIFSLLVFKMNINISPLICLFLIKKPLVKSIPTDRGLHQFETASSGGLAILIGFSISLIVLSKNLTISPR